MDYYALSNEKIAAELGQRVSRLRQRRGYSRESLAEAMSVDPVAVALLEKGKCDFLLFIAVLRELRAFGQLERFLKEARVRALELNDPESVAVRNVMYRRREADFKALKASGKKVADPKRKSDFAKKDGEEKHAKKTSRKPDISVT